MTFSIEPDFLAGQNRALAPALDEDFEALARQLARRGVAIEPLVRAVMAFGVAIPTWGVGTGGTRFARFPGPGEPRGVFDKLDDCAAIHQLTRATPTISPHFPWDETSDYAALRETAAAHGLSFDAVNSNTFQDQPGQRLSYKFGSLSHVDAAVRAQAIAHNIACIAIGKKLGSKALTVWIADGSNFAGQSNLTAALDRYLAAMREICAALPGDWRVFLEHKLYEPAFYSTVISDWGTSFAAAQELGPQAQCLVDLGHHAPNVNIEQIVARLIRFGKLGGFHFNDFEIWRRRPRRRLGRAVPPVPGVQRTGRRAGAPPRRLRARLYDRPVAQRHRSDREPDAIGDRVAARLCADADCRPRGAGGRASRQ